jgi:hypothetical protein
MVKMYFLSRASLKVELNSAAMTMPIRPASIMDEPYRPVAYSLTELGKKVALLISELEKVVPASDAGS